jgi:exodeoxyribonuclease-3
MLVGTYNVNSVNARLDFVLDFLRTREPDVLCLQELKVDDESFPRLAFAQAGYKSLTHGQLQWNGVAVLTRMDALRGSEPEVLRAGLPGQEAMGARVLTVRTLGLVVTSVYVPNGKSTSHPDYQAKLAWLDAFVAHVKDELDPKEQVVIGGDFNLVPSDLDTWDPKSHEGHIFHTDAERERWKRLVALGYHDLYRALEPETQTFSWWDYRGGAFHKKQGLRIDFLLGSEPVLGRTRKVWVDRDFRKKRSDLTPSDHAPVLAELA